MYVVYFINYKLNNEYNEPFHVVPQYGTGEVFESSVDLCKVSAVVIVWEQVSDKLQGLSREQ